MTDDDLIAAWEAWDERPGNDRLVIDLVNAVCAFTADSLEFRRYMAERRREGLERRIILDLWRQDHDDTP